MTYIRDLFTARLNLVYSGICQIEESFRIKLITLKINDL